ncbi:Transducin/WD40 repeat-like superfamily protein [Forsythia ovata]|uniref:Transducin/WD40 repeat-like superfamily protein n=1 Tax=Forsythia ovata TaxID=205694 RepID=A0ABD1VI97_9LAMI
MAPTRSTSTDPLNFCRLAFYKRYGVRRFEISCFTLKIRVYRSTAKNPLRLYSADSMATFGTTSANANPNPNRSTEVVQPPSDSVSSLCFSPKANVLVATSWDNQVRCWEIMKTGTSLNTVPKASISHEQPVLCSAWKDDGTTIFSGGCDKQVKMWPLLSGGQPVTVAMHDAPC